MSALKVRIKFEKAGPVKFVGHLDTMRYFQKAVRRAALPAAFTKGFSPHMIMSIACPLGVGTESEGEYFDLELTCEMAPEEIVSRLNAVMADGFRVRSAVRAPEGKAGNAMALVAAADYRIRFREGKAPADGWKEKMEAFMAQPSILITKTTKTGEKVVDIRPFIYGLHVEDDAIWCRLAAASANFTRPDQLMDAFFSFLKEEQKPFACMVTRLEIYADRGGEEGHVFVPLGELDG